MKCMLMGKRCPPTYIITPLFLKLWIFTNLNMVFPVLVLVFDWQSRNKRLSDLRNDRHIQNLTVVLQPLKQETNFSFQQFS
jgi:hypothetical protein